MGLPTQGAGTGTRESQYGKIDEREPSDGGWGVLTQDVGVACWVTGAKGRRSESRCAAPAGECCREGSGLDYLAARGGGIAIAAIGTMQWSRVGEGALAGLGSARMRVSRAAHSNSVAISIEFGMEQS